MSGFLIFLHLFPGGECDSDRVQKGMPQPGQQDGGGGRGPPGVGWGREGQQLASYDRPCIWTSCGIKDKNINKASQII